MVSNEGERSSHVFVLKCEAKERQSQESGKRLGSFQVREKVTHSWQAMKGQLCVLQVLVTNLILTIIC